jgi:hypothetical protein
MCTCTHMNTHAHFHFEDKYNVWWNTGRTSTKNEDEIWTSASYSTSYVLVEVLRMHLPSSSSLCMVLKYLTYRIILQLYVTYKAHIYTCICYKIVTDLLLSLNGNLSFKWPYHDSSDYLPQSGLPTCLAIPFLMPLQDCEGITNNMYYWTGHRLICTGNLRQNHLLFTEVKYLNSENTSCFQCRMKQIWKEFNIRGKLL